MSDTPCPGCGRTDALVSDDPRSSHLYCERCGGSVAINDPDDLPRRPLPRPTPTTPPAYWRQTTVPEGAREGWFREAAAEARAQGCTWMRMTIHPKLPDLCLVEGWTVRPESEGEPQFALTRGEDG